MGLGGGVGGLGLAGLLLDVQELAQEEGAAVGGSGGGAVYHIQGDGHVAALEVAAVTVGGAALIEFLEDHAGEVVQVLLRGVVAGAVGRELLHARKFLDVQEVGGAYYVVHKGVQVGVGTVREVEDPGLGHEPSRFPEQIVVEPVQGALLALFRDRGVLDDVFLLDAVVGHEAAADIGRHMAQVAVVLAGEGGVHPGEVLVLVGLLGIPLGKFADDALEVRDAVVAGRDGVVTEVLPLGARVEVGALAAEPEFGMVLQSLDDHLVPIEMVFLRGLELRRTVAVLDGPLVIVVDPGIQAFLADAVLRLRHVVEAGVVHDGHGVAVLFHPLLVAELLHRGLAAGAHVVAQAQGVAHLVGGDEADEVAHEFVVILEGAGARVHGAGLHLVPVVDQGHHVVVPADMAFQDFAGTGVMDIGPIGVGRGGGEVADDGETGVLHAHVGVVLRPFLGPDGVLPAGLLEGLLPVVHAGDQVRPPLFRGSRVDVIDDRLDGLHEFAALLLLHVLGTGFQAPAGDEAHALDGLLLVGELSVPVGEIAHSGVEQARLHGHFREEDHRGIEDEGHHAGLVAGREGGRSPGGTHGGRCRCVIGKCLGDGYFRVDGIGADALDETSVALEVPEVVSLLGAGAQGEHLRVALEKGRHFHAGAARGRFLLRLEGGNDGGFGTGPDGPGDFVAFIGLERIGVHPEEQVPVGGFLPVDHPVLEHLPAVFGGAGGMVHKAGDGEDPAAQQAVRHVEVPVLLVVGHPDHAGGDGEFRFRLFRGFLLFGFGILAGPGTGFLRQGDGSRDNEQCHGGEEETFHHICQDFP